jgi:hypothetical protein
VAAGQTRQFTATGAYSDNSTLDLTAFVTWSTSRTWIATIGNSADEQGIATGVSGGPATITAVLAGLSATASLSVSGPTLQSITVSPATASVVPGATQQFTATGRYSDNTTKDLTTAVTWSSSNSGIASISNSAGTPGIATGVAPGGPVTITATLNGAAGINARASLTVPTQSPNSNALWGVNAGGQIYHLNGNWTLIPRPSDKTPVQVSAGDGDVWALDSDGNIYSWRGTSWQVIPGTLRQVSVGRASNAWGVNYTNTIYRWNGSTWTQVPGPANRTPKEVSAAIDGTVWSLDTEGNIHSYTGSGWEVMPGTLAQVSVGNASNVWGLNSAGAIYQWNGSIWTHIPGPANRIPKQVSVGADGTVYLIDSVGNIYVRSGPAWQQLTGQLTQISAG